MNNKNDNKIGLIGATSYIAGTIIGSGIFVSPKGILMHAGSIGLSLIIWVTCAIIQMMTGMVYIELATSIPQSGGDVTYINYVGWKPFAFTFLWISNIVEASCSCAILFLTFGQYITEAIAPLDLDFGTVRKKYIEHLLGFALLWLLTWANFFSLKKYAAKIQIVITIFKLLSVSIIIVTGFYFLIFKGRTSHFEWDEIWRGSRWVGGDISLAIYSGLWAYSGYAILNYGTEDIEIHNIRKILPGAVLGGLSLATIVYVLANIAYFTILLPQEIRDSDAVAMTFSKRTLGSFHYAMPAIVAIIMIGGINSDLFSWSRFIVAGARARMMPSFLNLVHVENGSPRVALLFHVFLAIGFSFVGNIESLMNYMVVTGLSRQATCVFALIWIRWKKIPVSIHAIQFPMILHYFVFCLSLALIVVPVIQDAVAVAVGMGMLLVCLVGYFIFLYPNYEMKALHKLDAAITRVFQKIFMMVPDPGVEIEYAVDDNSKTKL